MAKGLSPQQVAKKWQDRVAASGDSYKQGISSVTRHPGIDAAAQRDLWLAKTQAAADKWQANVQAGSLQDWKNSALQFGASAYTAGAAKGAGKMQSFTQQFIPFVQGASASLPPRGNDSANQARYQAMQAQLKSFNLQKKGL